MVRSRSPLATGIELPVRQNLLLARLSGKDRTRIQQTLRPVEYELGDIVYKPSEIAATVLFPESGMLSTTIAMEDGGTAEVGGTGYEGLAGIFAFYGIRESPAVVACEIPGSGQAMALDDFERELEHGSQLWDAVRRFAFAVSVQTMQTAACNRLHDVEERLSRWILMASDRAGADTFPLTQQVMAYMLGVHRPTVTLVARTLQNSGLIRYDRGVVTVADREALESCACECYAVIRQTFETALSFRPHH